MSYFICIIADHVVGGKKVKGREIYDSLMDKHAWGLHPATVSQAKLVAGDKIVFYLGGAYEFLGIAVVKREAYKDESGESRGWYYSEGTYRVDLEQVEVWPQPKPIKPLLGQLSFIKNSTNWGAYLQGGVRKVSDSDFQIIIESQDYRRVLEDTSTPLATFLQRSEFGGSQFEPHSLSSPERIKIQRVIENLEWRWQIPNFQRYFDWNKEDVRSLLESVFNDYYIGAFLLWDVADEPPIQEIPIKGVEATDRKPEQTILDGQQRMTALYYAIKTPPYALKGGRRSFYYIDFKSFLENHENENVVIAANEPIAKDECFERILFPFAELPSYDVWINELEDHLLKNYGSAGSEKIRTIRRIIEKRLRHIWNGFEIPYIVLPGTLELAQVADIFENINTKGIQLSVFDLLIARLFKYGVELRALWEEVEQTHPDIPRYARKSDKIRIYIFQTMSLLYHPTSSAKRKDVLDIYDTIAPQDSQEFMELWKECAGHISTAIKMLENLRDGFGVRSEGDIPFLPMIPVLAALIVEAEKRNTKSVCYEKIRKWYWSAVFANAYSSSADTQMTADFKDVVDWFESDENVPRVVRQAERQLAAFNLQEITQAGNSIYRGVLSMLALKGAKDFESGLSLENARKNDKDHIFPQSVRAGFAANPRVDSVLNMTWLSKESNIRKGDKKPANYIPEFIQDKHADDEQRFREILETHYITPEAYDCLLANDLDGFTSAREKILKQEIAKLIGAVSALEVAMQETPENLIDELETRIRVFLDAKLRAALGEDYWPKLPSGVRQRTEEKIKQKAKRHPVGQVMSAAEKLTFCDVMDYNEIIVSNWDVFSTEFGSKSETEKHFLNLKEYRNALKHGRRMNNVERKQGEASLEWTFLIVGK